MCIFLFIFTILILDVRFYVNNMQWNSEMGHCKRTQIIQKYQQQQQQKCWFSECDTINKKICDVNTATQMN